MKRKLDIWLFCDARSIHSIKWINALREREHRLRIFSPWQGMLTNENVTVKETPQSPIPLPNSIKTLGKVLMRARNGRRIRPELLTNPPDIIHAHYILDSGWMAAQLDFHPFIVTIHGSDLLIHPERSRLLRIIANRVLKSCDKIVIVGDHMRQKLIDYKVSEKKIINVPSFIDTSVFYPTRKSQKNNVITIGSARNFEPVYKVETLIKAIPEMLKKFTNFELQLAGSGTQYQYLRSIIKKLEIEQYVKFLGILDQKKISDFFRNLDIYVSTAISDGISVTLLEALACGAYPVVTDIIGNKIVLAKAGDGVFFTPEDSNSLANILIDVIKNFNRLDQKRKFYSESIIKEYDKQTVVKKMEDIYFELL